MFRSRAYWMVAGLYMLSFGATALVEPYLVQHLLRLGLNGAQVGNLMAVVNMVGLVFIPLASSHADRSGRPRRAANASMLFQGISSAGMALLAQPFLIAAAVIPYRYFSTLGMTIRNRLALHWLEQRQSQDFGSLRLWGSIGFSVCALLGGLIAERLGVPFLFLLSGGLILCAILLMGTFAQQLPVSPPRKRRGRMPPALVLILLVTGMMALSRTAYTGWANDFIETGLGGGQSAVGAFGAIAALVEVPVMIYEYRLIRRWGASAMWVLGLILLAVTFWLFSGVQTVAQALMMAVLIGISQGFTIVAPVVLIGNISRPDNTTLNLALAGVLSNLGTMLGSPIAGVLFDQYGVRTLLQIGALAAALTTLMLVIGATLVHRAGLARASTR